MFTLRASVMWTVNDFPAYAMVSGWSTKGYMACPVCKEDVTSGWHAGKVCYLGHRRWLPWDHEWREKDKEFDGNTERRLRPREWSGDEILEQLNRLDFAPFGKTVSRTRPSTHLNWTHKPMFFELPYWSKLKLRHNLDVMHVEKNVFDTLVGTILDIEGKTKDMIKARLDLERMGIRRGLWMNRDSDKARRDLAFFSMKPNDKKEFLKFVSSVKFFDGYASNIARCVNVDGGKFTGLKSHDCHVFMQRLLPVGIRHLLPEDVVNPIMLLSIFFSQLTAKTLRRTDMFQLRHDIVQVLCKFEMIFPPAFFTSMMHVMVHLPEEALLAGPVNYRWMYPIEMLLGELKKKYVETVFNRPQRNNDGDEHEQMMKREHPSHLVARKHRELFPQWFLDSVNKVKSSNSPTYSDELYNLAFGPIRAELFSGCNVNGVKFLGAARDDKLCTQNSGVHVPGGGESTDIDFYGKLTTVVQLLYKDRYQVIMFKCRWFDTNPNRAGSVKIDHGVLSVNINRTCPLSPPSPQPPPRRHINRLPAVAASLPSLIRRLSSDSSPIGFSLLRPPFPTPEMSDLIRRGRSMTTAPSSDPPAQSASAATAPALLDHVVVGPGASQAPASSASSVAQPASARRRHRPTDTIDTTLTDGTGASGSQPAKKNTRVPCRQLKTAKVTRVTNSHISIGYDERHRAAPTAELHSSLAHDIGHVVRTHCPMQWKSWRVMPDEIKVEVRGQLSTNYNLEDLDEESLTYVNRLFAERYKQWKSDLHHHFLAFDDPQVALQEGCPKELEGREDSWEWLCAHFQAPEFVVFF
ncbi:hypothetical protein L3X38_005773 [Prunus dulcis]|uniref:DUF4218 domain-containing protein n=1 Tax=Prunus dulcis TaxID=3755 RepID=A0AAD4ZRN0_PRUDU|nr:hypothetical protein L3X38_005773 [Prunus dulcis]